MADKPDGEKREMLPFAVVLAFAFLGNDLFGVADECLRLFTGLSEGRAFTIVDLTITTLVAPIIIWGIWKRKNWSRWAFVAYYALAILIVTAMMFREIRESASDRFSLLLGYLFSISPTAAVAMYFGKSRVTASYLGQVKSEISES